MSGSGSRSKSASTRAHVRPVTDQPGVRPRTTDEPEGVDQEALAGARLAGDHVESRPERQAQPVDEREVAHRQLEEATGGHDGSSATLWRSRSQNGWAPSGSIRRIGRSTARTSTTSPTCDRDVLAAVDRDECLVRVDDRAADDLLGTDDDRADGRQVGRDRRHDEVPADGIEDRAAGRERVARGAGRARDDEAVGDEGREVGVVDRDVEAADAGERAAGDHDVVEREVAALVRSACRRAGSAPSSPIRSSIVNRPATILARTSSSSPASAFDRKPTLPRLMPRIGTSTSATARDGAQERSVAAEHDERVGRRELADQRVDVAGLELPVVDAADLAPAGRAGAQLDGRLDRRVVGEADPRDRHGGRDLRDPLVDLGTARARRRGGRGTRDCPRGPWIGEAMTRARAEADRLGGGHDPLEDLAVDRRVAHDAVVGPAAAGLELRLDERDDVTAAASGATWPGSAPGRARAR